MLVKSLSFPSNLFPSEIGTDQRWAPSKSSNSLSFSSKLQFLRKSTQNSSGVGPGDAVIIVDHGSRRKESNLMLNEFVEMFRHKTGYQIVEPAHMNHQLEMLFNLAFSKGHTVLLSVPFSSVLEGIGVRPHNVQDIPSLSAEAAKQHPGVSYIVTAPLGLHELLVDVVNDRINYCLKHVAGEADECSVCAGTGKCILNQ
ncbi:hypothetical protein KIW84_015117 [Lathyrus oleraceus]|uniref:Sirohydrochlorin ferrochelatase n=1 Tax=Pisum sativum TaxID=3888 RepID=A0A9D5GZX9_PEA|nr:hypothetical protein KIW84_015117 [Pisum sativum]